MFERHIRSMSRSRNGVGKNKRREESQVKQNLVQTPINKLTTYMKIMKIFSVFFWCEVKNRRLHLTSVKEVCFG